MKLKKITIITASAAILILAFALQALAMDFSAEFVEKDGDSVRKGKIYMTGQKSRFEMEGMDEIEVTRADKKVMWIIFPKKRVYVEEEFWGVIPGDIGETGAPKDTGDLSRKDLGYEMVDSYRLKKFLVTVKYNKGETQDQYYEWYRTGFPIPVKMESMNGAVSYEYKKIKMAPQAPSLFNEPKDYKKITIDELEKLEAEWAKDKKK
ncbi:MAG: DUF4412 domain-containing protein [Cloacibacillus porcorum]|uniref:hypothetical protein n=1 Tax=Cloacibacillus porcorum TaxID=1197717 RepID=UPI0023F33B4D|nr:hypothetical protein [Cloacibacillus porcorum]MCD7876716.1 DUF4412 domain-containing protein [Cloacibacillus porcorum]